MYLSDPYLYSARNNGDYTSTYFGIFSGAVYGNNLTGSGVTYSFANSNADVWFYQGTIPTDVEMNNFVSGTRIADCLLKFDNCLVNQTTNVLTFSSRPGLLGTVIGPGTIGWFCIGAQNQATAAKTLLYGTVGLSGSGADLIVPKTSVLANDLWTSLISLSFLRNPTLV